MLNREWETCNAASACQCDVCTRRRPDASHSERRIELYDKRRDCCSAPNGRVLNRSTFARKGICFDLIIAIGDILGRSERDDRIRRSARVVVGAGDVAGRIGLRRITGIGAAIPDFDDTSLFALMKHQHQEFGVVRGNRLLEVGDELPLVTALVFDDASVHVRAQVIHDELPLAAEVPGGEGHFGIYRHGFRNQHFDALRVPDVGERKLRVVEVRVADGLDAGLGASAGRRYVFVGQNDLVAVVSGDDSNVVEAKVVHVNAAGVVSDLPTETIAPVFAGRIPLGEAPIARNGRSSANALLATEAVQLPHGLGVNDQFQHGGRLLLERVLAEIAHRQQGLNQTLKHLRRQLEHVRGVGVGVNVDFLSPNRHPSIGERACRRAEIAVGDILVVGVLSAALAQEVALNRAGRRLQNLADDVRELLFGVRDVHVLVEAEQLGLPRLFFEEVGQPGTAPADGGFRLVARRSQAAGRRDLLPSLGHVRIHVVEAVAGVLGAGPCLKSSAGHMRHPAVFGPDVLDDVFVEIGLLIHEKLRECSARKNA